MPPTPEVLAKGLHFMHMDGRAVFRWAVAILCDTIQDVLTASNLKAKDIDYYFPHQANIRIINAAIDVLHIPRNKVPITSKDTATRPRHPFPWARRGPRKGLSRRARSCCSAASAPAWPGERPSFVGEILLIFIRTPIRAALSGLLFFHATAN